MDTNEAMPEGNNIGAIHKKMINSLPTLLKHVILVRILL
jgi:hypothetical protein